MKIDPIYFAFQKIVQEQVFENQSGPKICVVAWSGGADSTCLLFLLQLFFQQRRWDISNIHAVYVNHGWREEAQEEMKLLEAQSHVHGFTFHGCTIDKEKYKSGNLEEIARNERYQLLFSVCQKVQSHFLFVGHQKNDQVEGIFKRICEGSSLQALSGMSVVNQTNHNIQLIRPLLSFSRQDIEKWVSKNGLSFFNDPTNHSQDFTRARIRHTILPDIARQFGKKIEEPLLRIGQEANMLKKFVFRMRSSLYNIESIGKGFLLSVQDTISDEMKDLAFDSFFVEETLHSLKADSPILARMSRVQIEQIRDVFCGVKGKTLEKMFQVIIGAVLVKNGFMLVLSYTLEKRDTISPVEIITSKGGCAWGDFVNIAWHETDAPITSECPTWKDLLTEGRVQVNIPFCKDGCVIDSINDTRKKESTVIEICPFTLLRRYIPAIWSQKKNLLYSPIAEPRKAFTHNKERNVEMILSIMIDIR